MNILKKKFSVLLVLLVAIPSFVFSDSVYVKGYHRKDGTYVSGHYRNTSSSSSSRGSGSSSYSSYVSYNYGSRSNQQNNYPVIYGIIKDPKRNFSRSQKEKQYEEQNGRYNHCRRRVSINNAEADHIILHSKGGATTEDNLQILCRPCNRSKGNRYSY